MCREGMPPAAGGREFFEETFARCSCLSVMSRLIAALSFRFYGETPTIKNRYKNKAQNHIGNSNGKRKTYLR
jgi:hypothetical protein